MKKLLIVILLTVVTLTASFSQEKGEMPAPDPVDKYTPLTLKLSKDGSKYIRFVMWAQFWLEGQNNSQNEFKVNPLLRRARILSYAQVSNRFLILFHFGLNNLSASSMDPTGNRSDGPQIFFHGVWTEFAVVPEKIYIGAGLHYWNGISRFTNESTLNFMTLDNYRRSWATLGLTDQFARHLGVYAKGRFGRFTYRLAANSAIVNSLDVNRIPDNWDGQVLYTGKKEFSDQAAWCYQGYFEWEFFDKESNKLPFKVGTYLGKKKVLNIGAGFFTHPKGSITYQARTEAQDSMLIQHNSSHFAFDIFYDSPVGKGAITAYAAYYLFDYGPKYTLGQTYGTGSSLITQLGYLIPGFSKKISLQPYAAFNTANFDAFDNMGNSLRAGMNMFINGHHAKITLEYETTQNMWMSNTQEGKPGRNNKVILQAQVFL